MTDINSEDEKDAAFRGKLTDVQWAEACELYETDKMGLAQIADKFAVSRQNLHRRFKENSIVRGSRVAADKFAEQQATIRYADKRASWIEETRLQGFAALKQAQILARKTVVDAVKATKSMESIDDDLKAIQRFNKILCDNISATLSLLESDKFVDEENLPTLIIEDLTDEDILNHHRNTGALDDGGTMEDLNIGLSDE
jgi:hypothetical protein